MSETRSPDFTGPTAASDLDALSAEDLPNKPGKSGTPAQHRDRSVNHVLLTRFNLPSSGLQGKIRAADGWLRERVELFEKYTVPSVLRQTNTAFTWLIYFDPSSPQWLRDRISLHHSSGTFTPKFREQVSDDEIYNDVRDAVGSTATELLTTNLDNDDVIAVDFIDRIQALAPATVPRAIYITHGAVRSDNHLYALTYPRNAFNSVRASWTSPPVTCWTEWHNHYDDLMPVDEIDGPPGWMQVIHGSNVSNRIKGSLIRPAQFRLQFNDTLADMPEPTRRQLLIDQAFHSPTRHLREAVRATGKAVIVKSLGRDGLDRTRLLGQRLLKRPGRS